MSEELTTVNSYLYGDTTKDEFCCVFNVWKGGCDFNNDLGLIELQVADISDAISNLIEEIKKLFSL
jgi:hypothetical protein